MYESPRKVEVMDGKFTDWFAPFEVHVLPLQTLSLLSFLILIRS